jgi:hypothetical protein
MELLDPVGDQEAEGVVGQHFVAEDEQACRLILIGGRASLNRGTHGRAGERPNHRSAPPARRLLAGAQED